MSNPKDTLINLSFSIHSGPGTYALLLGSGISQGAGIPTGWQIVLDLIRKLAILEGVQEIIDPEEWYKEKYRLDPSYSFIIEKIAPSISDRRNLLKKYIEPSEEESVANIKTPSFSHKAIAQLVKNRYIKINLTTNIDQLLESALKEIGITPVIIFNEDSLIGAMPYVHSECTIIKLHGDYLDTRIKNTKDELCKYSEEMNKYLDRIFDEFGLIICGWSAESDIALRDALFRRQSRRFSIFWVYPHEIKKEAVNLIDHLQGITSQIKDADTFFQKLHANVLSLEEYDRPHPLSIPLAIAQVKKYLVDDRFSILLHDMFQDEIKNICELLKSDKFLIKGLTIPDDKFKEVYQHRMHEYEEIIKLAIGIFSTYLFFGLNKPIKPTINVIERLLDIPFHEGLSVFIALQYYPALLIKYSCGISALESENYSSLYPLLTLPQSRDDGRRKKSLELLNAGSVFSHDAHRLIPVPEGNYTPVSDYLCKFIFGELNHIITDKQRYIETFDIFEYLYGLTYVDQLFPDLTDKWLRGPYGRFKWRYRWYQRAGTMSPIDEFFTKGISLGNDWDLLRAGFFNHSIERLIECKSAYDSYLNKIGEHWM